MPSSITSLRSAKFCGCSTKSFGCQPEAMAMPARPAERLSTSAQSSAARIGWCSGSTQEPPRTLTRLVRPATAAELTAGLG